MNFVYYVQLALKRQKHVKNTVRMI